MRDSEIKTPETHPDHHTVGKDFMNWFDSHRYFCDSYDPSIGYWMTRIDAPTERWADQHSEFRRNVSVRAIGATLHRIHVDYHNGKVYEHVAGGKPTPRPEGAIGAEVYDANFRRNFAAFPEALAAFDGS